MIKNIRFSPGPSDVPVVATALWAVACNPGIVSAMKYGPQGRGYKTDRANARKNLQFSQKKSLFAVDALFSLATLLTPLDAGLP